LFSASIKSLNGGQESLEKARLLRRCAVDVHYLDSCATAQSVSALPIDSFSPGSRPKKNSHSERTHLDARVSRLAIQKEQMPIAALQNQHFC